MATYEGNTSNNPELKRKSNETVLWLNSHASHTHTTFNVNEDSLVQKFQNVGLRSNDTEAINEDYGGPDGSRLHPLRPYAEDCTYYIRTGTCKFGLNCKFNHPVRTTIQFDKDEYEEGLSNKLGQIECKYYLTGGGCKYGNSCRYYHSKPESEISLPELNFLGLPIRLGEKECPFYMRNGSCGYGACCRFHHPNPTTGGGSDPRNSTLNDEGMGQFGCYSGHCDAESFPSHFFGVSTASQIAQASWDSHILFDTTVPYLDNCSSYMPEMHSLPQKVHQNPAWSGYQAPKYPQERIRTPHSAPAAINLMEKANNSMQVEEFPERPGQPECDYYMRTGDCKFKSACRFHHPKNRAPKAEVCVLNEYGLPLRPDKEICWDYENYGICKYGRACMFDHPLNLDSSASLARSIFEPLSGTNAGAFEGTRMAGSRDEAEE